MNQDISRSERAFIDDIGTAFLERTRPPHPDALSSWRPSGITWPLLRRLQGRAAGLQRHETHVDGRKMIWLQGGNPEGQTVVLFHGFGASKENWLPLLPMLTRRYQVFVPDLPGWGESHFSPDMSYGMDHQAERLSHWLAHHVSTPAHIVGSSMGGALAGFVTARSSEICQSLTLMNAAGARGSRASAFEQDLLKGRNTLVARRFGDVLRLFTTTTERNRYLIAAALGPVMFREMVSRRHVNRHMFRELISHVPDENLPGFTNIDRPTLILWGDRDKVLDVSCVDTFQQLIPHAKRKLLQGIGHLPMVEAPGLTARYLRRFWRSTANN